MQRAITSRLAGFLLAALLGGCAATTPQTIATVEGPAISGIISRPLEIIGVLHLSTTSGNVPNAEQGSHFVTATVEVPVGTAVIVPALKGWLLGFGEAQPSSANPDTHIDWSNSDHNFGLGSVEVSVTRIDPPNTTTQPPTQTAEISVRFLLGDDNLDDPWFGSADFTLLCLGVPGAQPTSWTPIPFEPPVLRFVPR